MILVALQITAGPTRTAATNPRTTTTTTTTTTATTTTMVTTDRQTDTHRQPLPDFLLSHWTTYNSSHYTDKHTIVDEKTEGQTDESVFDTAHASFLQRSTV